MKPRDSVGKQRCRLRKPSVQIVHLPIAKGSPDAGAFSVGRPIDLAMSSRIPQKTSTSGRRCRVSICSLSYTPSRYTHRKTADCQCQCDIAQVLARLSPDPYQLKIRPIVHLVSGRLSTEDYLVLPNLTSSSKSQWALRSTRPRS